MKPIRTRPIPYCQICGGQMRLVRAKPGSQTQFAPFWGCQSFPACKGTRNIMHDGRAEGADDEWERLWRSVGSE